MGAFFPVKDDPLAILLNSLKVLHYNLKKEQAIDAKFLSNMAKWLRWELGKGLSEVDAGSHGAAWGQIYPEYLLLCFS